MVQFEVAKWLWIDNINYAHISFFVYPIKTNRKGTGIDKINKIDVIIIDQLYNERLFNKNLLVFILIIVIIKFIELQIEDKPFKCKEKTYGLSPKLERLQACKSTSPFQCTHWNGKLDSHACSVSNFEDKAFAHTSFFVP